MKPLRLAFSFALICLVTGIAYAQITITMADVQSWFAVGTSWLTYNADSMAAPTNMNVGNASSTAQVWTLPSIAWTDTSRNDNVAPSSTPYASSFPQATHCQKMIETMDGETYTMYQYTRLANDSLIFLGGVQRYQAPGIDQTTTFMQYRVEVTFPATIGYTITRRDSIPLGQGSYLIENATETFDAHGTLSVGGTSYNVLRSKTVSVNVTYSGNTEVSRDTTTSFFWVAKEGILTDVEAANNQQTSGTIPIQGASLQTVITTPSGVFDLPSTVPSEIWLSQNYPNPFNPATTIEFSLKTSATTKFSVFNVLGEEVAVLVDGSQSAGPHRVTFDARELPSGIYIYRLSAAGNTKSGKMILMR